MFLRSWQKHYFDLTAGETTEAFILRTPVGSVSSIEIFIAAAIQHMMELLGYSLKELPSELDTLDIEVIPPTTKLPQDPFALLNIDASKYPLVPELDRLQLLYTVDIGPCSVQQFYIARTQSEYVSLFWYTTG